MMSQKKPHSWNLYKSVFPGNWSSYRYIIILIAATWIHCKFKKWLHPPAIPAGGFLGACSVTSMMVQTTSNGNCTAKQVIKLHFWWFTPLFWHSLYVSWAFSLKHQGKKLKSKNPQFSFKYCSHDNMYYRRSSAYAVFWDFGKTTV